MPHKNEAFCSGGGTRTPDKVINSHLLYQLSYSGIVYLKLKKAGKFRTLFLFLKVTILFQRIVLNFL